MIVARVHVSGVSANAVIIQNIPRGIIGAEIEVSFDSQWSGLAKTAVFSGVVIKDVTDFGNTITIPTECVGRSGRRLKVGFYGTSGKSLVIPTLWADLGTVYDATDPSGDTSTDPQLPVWAQLQDQINDIAKYGIGIPGPKGDTGATGPQGPKGDKGDTGDAYEEPPIVCPSNGEVITLADSAERPLHGMKLYGKTIQNGTPTPDAPVPLETVGADGNVAVTVADKNLLGLPYHNSNGFTHNGIQYTVKPNGAVICNGTATAESLFTVKYLMTLSAGTYWLVGCPLESGGQLYLRTEDKSVIVRAKKDGAEFTLTKDDTFTLWVDIFTGTKVENVVFYPVICKKRQTAAFSTPNGLPGIPVSSGGNYIDENGQMWICDEIDFVRGKYVKHIGTKIFKGTEAFTQISSNTNCWRVVVPEMWTETAGGSDFNTILALSCSHFKPVRYKSAAQAEDKTVTFYSTGEHIIRFTHNSKAVPEYMAEQYAAGNPVKVLYKLAVPTETNLTAEELAQYSALHTNYPTTTIYTDEGAGMSVDYVADTKLYIDNKFAELATALLNN